MSVPVYNLRFVSGDDASYVFRLAGNVTADTFTFKIRKSTGSVLNMIVSSGLTVSYDSGSNKTIISALISRTDTATFGETAGYSLKQETSGFLRTIIKGALIQEVER